MIGKTVIVKTYNVLILGTGNSARSIMAEALFNTMGHGVFTAYSAGSSPTGVVNRYAVEEVKCTGYPTKNLRSKSWDEFSQPRAPEMNFVITVCDNAARETPPALHGSPVTIHWGFEDPAIVEGSFGEKKEAFKKAFLQIRNRIDLFTQLPLAHLDQESLNHEMGKWEKN